jgi:hypothetical protein
MMMVPEMKTVFILVPRTGSGTLYRELQRVYPRSMLLYRHMEADGCPRGYDRWRRVGFVRHPLMRLWSLYNFMRNFAGGAQVQGGAASADAARVRGQTEKPFEEWLTTNENPWTVPYDLSGQGDYWPVLSRINGAPENRLSQFDYLRPDLGTTVLKFENLAEHMVEWGLNPAVRKNHIDNPPPSASRRISDHLSRFCAWDINQQCAFI